jgi:hypothetical protein
MITSRITPKPCTSCFCRALFGGAGASSWSREKSETRAELSTRMFEEVRWRWERTVEVGQTVRRALRQLQPGRPVNKQELLPVLCSLQRSNNFWNTRQKMTSLGTFEW